MRSRGSQKRPSCKPYSTAIAETSAFIGVIIGFTQTGTSSIDLGSSSVATAQMSIGTASRYAARTSWPELVSNQSDPTREIPFRLARPNLELAQLNDRPVRQLEAHRIAGLVRVVRLGAVGDRVHDLVLVDLRARHAAADPERLVSREVRNRRVQVGIVHLVAASPCAPLLVRPSESRCARLSRPSTRRRPAAIERAPRSRGGTAAGRGRSS